MFRAIWFKGFKHQGLDKNVDRNKKNNDGGSSKRNKNNDGGGNKDQKHGKSELGSVNTSSIDHHTVSQVIGLPEISEPSLLLSDKTRSFLHVSLPALVQGRKWVLLYSTWRHGISLSTLYRRSTICPGFSLLVVGDQRGAVFGGLVEAPLSNKKWYQGTNNTFVFTNTSGQLAVFRPTGANRYFTLCSSNFLAFGGGGHFALYLDGELLSGSSSISETFGNPCLAHTKDFKVKEVELWGFASATNYEEIVAFSRTEAPGICQFCYGESSCTSCTRLA